QTATGVVLLVLVPLPRSGPPQATTPPPSRSPTLVLCPAATALTPLSCWLSSVHGAIAPTAQPTTGTLLEVSVPLPSRPEPLLPQVTTVPFSSSARPQFSPAALAFTPPRALAHGPVSPTPHPRPG